MYSATSTLLYSKVVDIVSQHMQLLQVVITYLTGLES